MFVFPPKKSFQVEDHGYQASLVCYSSLSPERWNGPSDECFVWEHITWNRTICFRTEMPLMQTVYCHVHSCRRLQSGFVGDHSLARQRDCLINLGIDLSVTLLCTGVDKTMTVTWISMNHFTDTQSKDL